MPSGKARQEGTGIGAGMGFWPCRAPHGSFHDPVFCRRAAHIWCCSPAENGRGLPCKIPRNETPPETRVRVGCEAQMTPWHDGGEGAVGIAGVDPYDPLSTISEGVVSIDTVPTLACSTLSRPGAVLNDRRSDARGIDTGDPHGSSESIVRASELPSRLIGETGPTSASFLPVRVGFGVAARTCRFFATGLFKTHLNPTNPKSDGPQKSYLAYYTQHIA